MKIKLLHLNILCGQFINNIIQFVKDNDCDILLLQEVAFGNCSYDRNKQNNFEVLKTALDMNGVFEPSIRYAFDKTSGFGNAILFKKSFSPLTSNVIWLKPYEESKKALPLSNEEIAALPRNALSIVFKKENKTFTVITTHLAWGPTPIDEPYKINQARILFDYLKSTSTPRIIGGDFNVTPTSEIVEMISSFGKNLTIEHNIHTTHSTPEPIKRPSLPSRASS